METGEEKANGRFANLSEETRGLILRIDRRLKKAGRVLENHEAAEIIRAVIQDLEAKRLNNKNLEIKRGPAVPVKKAA